MPSFIRDTYANKLINLIEVCRHRPQGDVEVCSRIASQNFLGVDLKDGKGHAEEHYCSVDYEYVPYTQQSLGSACQSESFQQDHDDWPLVPTCIGRLSVNRDKNQPKVTAGRSTPKSSR